MATILFMAFNLVSACAIIFINKLLFRTYAFPYATFTTGCHFVITFLGAVVCKQIGMFESKKLSQWDVLSITLFFVGFVVFNNLSLNYNAVGFYQLMKVMTTPVIASIQYFAFGQDLHWKLKLALCPIIVGVAMATVSDITFNMTGFIFAVLGILSTSYYQISVKQKQKDLNANAFQILLYQAPQAAGIVFVLTPFLDPKIEFALLADIAAEGLSPEQSTVAGILLISCLLAFCVNLSIFLVIGNTSPISYNVLGHTKLLIILTGGILFFGDDTNNIRMCGMVMAFVGIVAYTHLKINMNEKQKDSAETSQNSPSEEEVLLVEIVNKGN